jgi:hypothetical protein
MALCIGGGTMGCLLSRHFWRCGGDCRGDDFGTAGGGELGGGVAADLEVRGVGCQCWC